ncbi:unnamed protein product [Acanthoscelides obtectus]|uniref:Uncharacterized protein n=1 Tax=Acanthoscelides obtectus TaxID=200917 RepID=A0A9P0JTJ4_ACAOB|nr:unnamed protein product [Acanthoscelides obtectus]CAK1633941.1 hypothetical protein AOBTE_LOCUS8495 [Acanthoscelides obtectus]
MSGWYDAQPEPSPVPLWVPPRSTVSPTAIVVAQSCNCSSSTASSASKWYHRIVVPSTNRSRPSDASASWLIHNRIIHAESKR